MTKLSIMSLRTKQVVNESCALLPALLLWFSPRLCSLSRVSSWVGNVCSVPVPTLEAVTLCCHIPTISCRSCNIVTRSNILSNCQITIICFKCFIQCQEIDFTQNISLLSNVYFSGICQKISFGINALVIINDARIKLMSI